MQTNPEFLVESFGKLIAVVGVQDEGWSDFWISVTSAAVLQTASVVGAGRGAGAGSSDIGRTEAASSSAVA